MVNTYAKLAVLVICAAVAWRWMRSPPPPSGDRDVKRVGALQSLLDHSRKFDTEKIVKVTDGVYVAIGYALANMIMIEGTDGIVLVDTTEHSGPALKAFADFRKITSKPLKGIVITHFHLDHVVGAVTLLEQNPGTHIYMHETSEFELSRFLKLGEINFKRASRQFGIFLEQGREKINAGIGHRLMQDHDMIHEAAEISHTYKDRMNFTLAGINFELIHTPGETDDQTTVWLPDKKVVMPADNIYETFPNLYAIRGTPPRSCENWFKSLDIVRHLGAHHMVPSHTRPLSGKEVIYDVVTHYRDAIQFVNDQTIRWMNKGATLDEIVQKVNLPPKLKDHPWLQEHYGTVAWSVRSVYDYFLGWFDGDPANLNPLTQAERAAKWSSLLSAGSSLPGHERMVKEAERSLVKADEELKSSGVCKLEEMQWGLEMAGMAREASRKDVPSFSKATNLYIRALRSLASCTNNANARNYYLTCVREVESGLKLVMSDKSKREIVLSKLESDDLMSFIPLRFKAEECDDAFTVTVGIAFADVERSYYYTIRHCVVEYFPSSGGPSPSVDATLTTTSAVWRQMVVRERNLVALYASGEFTLEGSWLAFKDFMALLESSV